MPRYIAILLALPLLLSCGESQEAKLLAQKKVEEQIDRKKIGNIDKPLNLSLHFHDTRGYKVSYDTIDGNVIRTILYPYSINIISDSIMIIARWREGDEEYRGKLTDEQHSEIKKKVSELNQEYEYYAGRSARWTCMLEIDNQVHYIYRFCSHAYKFSHPKHSPMPKEIELLFQYIVGLSPISIM